MLPSQPLRRIDSGDEDSFTSGSSGGSGQGADEPPSFDDMLYDPRLFQLFCNYMKAQQAAENVIFLRRVFQFRMYRAPKAAIIREAQLIAWTFVSEAALTPVNVSSQERESLMEYCFDPELEQQISESVFHDSYQAIFNLVLPHYRDWLSTGEWHEVGHFHHIPLPSFSIVLETPELVDLFSKYLKVVAKSGATGSLSDPLKLWEFCIIAKDFQDGNLTHESEFVDAGSSDGKPLSKEEYAKKLYRKFKHHMPIPRDSSMPYSVYIVSALNKTIELFGASSVFLKWLGQKQYVGVDYLSKTVHQTRNLEGFVVPPTFATSVASQRGEIMMMLRGTDEEKSFSFILDVLEFENIVRGVVPGKKGQIPVSYDSSVVTSKKDALDEAKRIYKLYLEDTAKSGMYCDPALVEEVKAAMKAAHKSKSVRSDIFRRCGTFEFYRMQKMFGRELQAGLAWTSKSYDNNCKRAREILTIFDEKILPPEIDYCLAPSADDMLANDNLKKDFEAFIPKELSRIYEEYLAAYMKISSVPVDQRSDEVESVSMLMAAGATKYKELELFYKAITKGINGRKKVSNNPFETWMYALTSSLVNQFFQDWVDKRSEFWSTAPWTPVKEAIFSRVFASLSSSNASGKLVDTSAKKSGFSGLFSKRSARKRTPIASGSSRNMLVSPPPKELGSGYTSPSSSGSIVLQRCRSSASFGGDDLSDISDAEDLSVHSLGSSSMFLLPPIPTLQETLSSAYLRKLFEKHVLENRLPDDEMPLWKKFCEFYNKFLLMSDSDIESCQEEMHAAALEILDKYESFMKKGYFLRSYITKKGLITPSFFREEEMNQFRQYYKIFEAFLRQKGWGHE